MSILNYQRTPFLMRNEQILSDYFIYEVTFSIISPSTNTQSHFFNCVLQKTVHYIDRNSTS
jgi:hypothetical protein